MVTVHAKLCIETHCFGIKFTSVNCTLRQNDISGIFTIILSGSKVAVRKVARLEGGDTVTTRASVKLFELGVRTPRSLFLGVWYAGGIDFRRFSYAKPSDFRRNFWPTRSDEDVYVVLVNIIKDRLHNIYNAVDYYTSRGSYVLSAL